MPLVTASDFNLVPYSIPNIEMLTSFVDFIEEQESLVLNNILGRLLATKFLSAIEQPNPDQRWVDLRDGKSYIVDGDLKPTFHFDGVRKLMVHYIFFKWTEYSVETNSGIGVVSSEAENSQVVSPEFTLSRAYNDYHNRVGHRFKQRDSLYGYLFNSGNTYLQDVAEYGYSSIKHYLKDYFKPTRSRNSFGL